MLSRRSLLGSLAKSLLAAGVIAAPLATLVAPSEVEAEQAPSPTPSSTHIYFPTGLATLDTEAHRALRVASALYLGIGTQIQVTGYADKTGNHAANVELAKKRAEAVRDELVSLGVVPQRIKLLTPVDVTGSGSDDQARRVDLVVAQ